MYQPLQVTGVPQLAFWWQNHVWLFAGGHVLNTVVGPQSRMTHCFFSFSQEKPRMTGARGQIIYVLSSCQTYPKVPQSLVTSLQPDWMVMFARLTLQITKGNDSVSVFDTLDQIQSHGQRSLTHWAYADLSSLTKSPTRVQIICDITFRRHWAEQRPAWGMDRRKSEMKGGTRMPQWFYCGFFSLSLSFFPRPNVPHWGKKSTMPSCARLIMRVSKQANNHHSIQHRATRSQRSKGDVCQRQFYYPKAALLSLPIHIVYPWSINRCPQRVLHTLRTEMYPRLSLPPSSICRRVNLPAACSCQQEAQNDLHKHTCSKSQTHSRALSLFLSLSHTLHFIMPHLARVQHCIVTVENSALLNMVSSHNNW